MSLPLSDSDDDGLDLIRDDISSDWSAKDSIDLEVKAMHRQARKEKAASNPKLAIEKELKKGELDVQERRKLKEITKKPGKKEYNSTSVQDAEKVAQDILKEGKYEDMGGLDSSIDSDEFDEELRDQVSNENGSAAKAQGSEDEEVANNTDMTYYAAMNID